MDENLLLGGRQAATSELIVLNMHNALFLHSNLICSVLLLLKFRNSLSVDILSLVLFVKKSSHNHLGYQQRK